MKRIALALTGWPYRVREMVRIAVLAEKRGYEMVWSAEDYFTGRDGISPLACFCLTTERVKLGSCVIGPYTRSPGLIAATMATLDELSEGRIVLGLGAGLGWAPMYSGIVDEMKSVKTLRESIQLVRDLFSNRIATYRDKALTIRGDPYWWPDGVVRPLRDKIPIYVGARGPRMLRMTAEVADGLIIELGVAVPIVRRRIEQLREYAERAGRDPDEIDVACLVTASVSGTGMDEATRRFVASRIMRIDEKIYPMELSGVDEEEVSSVRQAFQKGGLKEASKHVSEKSASIYMAFGSPERCIQKIREYVAAGVKQPTIFPLGADLDAIMGVGEAYAKQTT